MWRSVGLPPLRDPKRFCRNRPRPDQPPQAGPGRPDGAGRAHPGWFLLLVAVHEILSNCESLRDLESIAQRHHGVLSQALGLERKLPPTDSGFRYFCLQAEVAAV